MSLDQATAGYSSARTGKLYTVGYVTMLQSVGCNQSGYYLCASKNGALQPKASLGEPEWL